MKRITKTKISFIIIGLVLMSLITGFASGLIRIHAYSKTSDESDLFIKELGSGYNIGNSLDACDWSKMFTNTNGNSTETSWGTPAISEEFIKVLEEQGFGTIRVPVTYMNHIDKDGNIDAKWLDRVAEVVDMVIAHNMYCIIDIHHDTGNDGWIRASRKSYSDDKNRVENLIHQIADRFKDYDNHLILEGFNEMVDEDCHWENAPISSLVAMNKWNQLFVDTVRATGGGNSDRYLLVNTYAATVNAKNIYFFDMPKDSAKDRIIVGVHNYAGPKNLKKSFSIINSLRKRGYPVIIGEYGNTANADYDRADFVKSYIEQCKEYGCCPIWWDNGQDPEKKADTSFALYKRSSGEAYFQDILDAITNKIAED
ncbi:glycoside hydrolase family 5 protein [Butyrivibrio sp. FC2001]|uniref:glycoside hydrolase family 5 protein n=1 Tax=Butyrivibrio sp. FC2001 TaxID=1280671 RepID=UPI00041112B8|nr:glycoside hydrolase family 5 protein [Butyrivibrio sp. FC2001]